MALLLGIDIGSTTIKVVTVDVSSKEIVESNSLATDSQVVTPDGRKHEQSPQKILKALQDCLTRCQYMDRISAVGICGQMHGVVLWGSRKDLNGPDLDKCSNLVTWQDTRCDESLLACLPKPFCGKFASGFGCATLFWYQKHEPEYLAKFSHAATIMDFIVAILTESDGVKMSVQNAASWGFYDPYKQSWEKDKLSSVGFPLHLLPEVTVADCQSGITAGVYGIPHGLPISVAFGDLQCSTFAAIGQNKHAVLNLGTSSQLAFDVGQPDPSSILPPSVDLLPYFGGHWLAVAASLNGGNVLEAFVSMIHQWLTQLNLTIEKEKIWETLENIQEDTSFSTLQILPTLFGERHLPNLSASASGLTPMNANLESIFTQICYGLVDHLASMMPKDLLIKHKIQRIIANGSVIEKFKPISDRIQCVFDIPVDFVVCPGSAHGAALAALPLGQNT